MRATELRLIEASVAPTFTTASITPVRDRR